LLHLHSPLLLLLHLIDLLPALPLVLQSDAGDAVSDDDCSANDCSADDFSVNDFFVRDKELPAEERLSSYKTVFLWSVGHAEQQLVKSQEVRRRLEANGIRVETGHAPPVPEGVPAPPGVQAAARRIMPQPLAVASAAQSSVPKGVDNTAAPGVGRRVRITPQPLAAVSAARFGVIAAPMAAVRPPLPAGPTSATPATAQSAGNAKLGLKARKAAEREVYLKQRYGDMYRPPGCRGPGSGAAV
jgi:hypothetical protein